MCCFFFFWFYLCLWNCLGERCISPWVFQSPVYKDERVILGWTWKVFYASILQKGIFCSGKRMGLGLLFNTFMVQGLSFGIYCWPYGLLCLLQAILGEDRNLFTQTAKEQSWRALETEEEIKMPDEWCASNDYCLLCFVQSTTEKPILLLLWTAARAVSEMMQFLRVTMYSFLRQS